MDANTIQAIADIVTVIVSIGGSLFVAGARWGAVKAQLIDLKEADSKHASKDDVHAMREQLAEIRGMFRLTLKDD